MELFDDWGSKKRLPPKPVVNGRASLPPPTATAIGEALAGFEPQILNVHCYEDVGYAWVQVVFGEMIHPDVAIRVGATLAAVAGEPSVYLNSLRPNSVYFLLEPAFAPEPDLKISRYGACLTEIKKSWSRSGKRAPREDC